MANNFKCHPFQQRAFRRILKNGSHAVEQSGRYNFPSESFDGIVFHGCHLSELKPGALSLTCYTRDIIVLAGDMKSGFVRVVGGYYQERSGGARGGSGRCPGDRDG